MKRNKKSIAFLLIIAMLASSFLTLFSGVSMAVQSDVTVVISADSDSMLKISDGETERKSFNLYM